MDSVIIGKVKVAAYKKMFGLSLPEREIKLVLDTIEEAAMEEMKQQVVETFEDSVDQVLGELRALMLKKQRDYGPLNIMSCGEKGVAVRANDKMARLLNLHGISDGTYQAKTAQNEAVEDTWQDLANYAIIGLMVRRGTFHRPLREKSQALVQP